MVGHGRYPGTANTQEDITEDTTVGSQLLSDHAIPAIPRDPLTPDYEYKYEPNTHRTSYTITWCMETDSVKGYTAGCSNTITP